MTFSIRRIKAIRKDSQGFTLVELMIAVALGAFLIGGIVLMFSSTKASSLDAERLARMQENIRFASDLMIRDIRNAGFRDEVGLLVADWESIGSSFAAINNGGLEIKYGGRGTCVEEFLTEKLVVNRYFLQDGELRCVGVGGANAAQTLVSGLTDLQFSILCPASNPVGCSCDLKDDPADPDPCIGVRVRMTFEGPRGDNGVNQPRDILLTAAFRNVILEDIAIDAES